jgi:dipeptidyl aminopeptidase/acylaminoacyl peptidase
VQPADIARVVAPAEPRLSPDASLLAFTVMTPDLESNRAKTQVWLTPTDRSSPPYPFTAGAERDGHARWSPDGRFLAFTSHREETGSQLLVAPVGAGGEMRTLVSLAEEIEALEWSPDGSSLAFTARLRDEAQYAPQRDADRPARRIRHLGWKYDNAGWIVDRPRSLFVVEASGMSPHRVLLTGGHDVGPSLSWTRDSTAIVIAHGGHETADVDRIVDLWSVPLDGGQPNRLTDGTQTWSQPVVAPEEDRIAAYRGEPRDPVRNARLVLLDPATGDATEVAPDLDRGRSVISPTGVLFDSDRIWYSIEDRGSTAVYASPAEAVLSGDRVVTGVDVRNGTIAYTDALPTGPFRVVVRDVASGDERELASYSIPFPTSVPEKLHVTTSDGAEVDGWFVPPLDLDPSRTYPVLLNIHGGPYSQYGYGFFDEFQVQAAAGYGVVYCNPRGSSGYGEAWGRAIRGPKCDPDPGTGWGGIDASDVLSVLDAALDAHPYLDRERTGVLGGSYGGYLTSWLVTQTDRFAAACSERAVNNMVTMSHTSDIGWWFNTEYAGVTPMEDTEELLRMSPVTYADRITTPLLIVHSENDWRCPIEQAEDLYTRLRLLGRDVEFVRFPGEGHELSRSGAPKHRIERFEIILEFFSRHLK